MEMRRLQYEDLPTRVEWMNDERVNRTLNIKLPVTLESTIEWFERVKDREDRVDFVFVDDGKLVAMGGIVDVDRSVGKAEVYMFVSPESIGNGYGYYSEVLLYKYAFTEMKLERIVGLANSDNLPAIKIMERLGFLKIEVLYKSVCENGQVIDRCRLELKKEDFKF